ncbi:glycoside hydrolase family 9 protein [Bradyrhizobium sp. McL0615]|uniref:glycoside hydrolase family 9 protein n=1 Tax=Bradyrhizobium sp. McL0615 TaxID=3415673 RepID=UPI003CF14806
MRYGAWCLVASLLVGVSTSHAQVGGTEPQKSSVQSDVAAADWKKNLTTGPNGPIPVIVVDQFGYLTKSKKVAVIRAPQVGYDSEVKFSPGSSYALVELPTGKIVKAGAPATWNGGNTDQTSGDNAWWFDFSEIEAPGKYAVVDIEKGIRSATFSIDEHIFKDVMKHALRAFFYQRAGFEKKPEFAGQAWADKASHLGPGQDPETRPWHEGRRSNPAKSLIKDLRGGWYDAGDYNKYTSWTARYIITLLQAYREHPQAFSDDYDIPESGNGVPDILDEVKWGLDWLSRMQNPDGSLLCVQALASASPPSAARGDSYYGPPTTSATLMGAAAYAYASKVFATRPEPYLKQYGDDLKKRATAAWTWATANPKVVYYNNDDSKQPGSKGLAAGQQEMSEIDRLRAHFEAAIYLFEMTGEAQFKQFADANYGALLPSWGPSMWEVEVVDSLLYYAQLPGATPEAAASIRERLLANLSRDSEAFQASLEKTDPYRAPMKDYTWGSNKGKTMQARLLQLAALYDADPKLSETSLAAALEYAHYLHGVNPLGLVYLTNMAQAGASHSATTMFHSWFARGTRWQRVTEQFPGPPPGFLVGGPNPQFSIDSCCSAPPGSPGYRCYSSLTIALCQRNFKPPLDQPAAKSYLEYNDPWPANSWEITEPSLHYQSYYIRLLAAFTR